jgi:uncharacterized protein with PQ loop repeat
MLESIGWLATAMFAASYFCKTPTRLRVIQASAAALWFTYGVIIHAPPVIVANVVVAVLALYSVWRQPRSAQDTGTMNDAPGGLPEQAPGN